MSRIYTGEGGYIDLVNDVLENGFDIFNERTGHFCRSIFDAKFIIPAGVNFLVTHRPVPLRLAFEEMWFFLRGEMDTKKLEEKGCNFWVGNTRREFLDKNGLHHIPEGHLGLAYSAQWRNSGGYYYKPNDNSKEFFNRLDWKGKDQLDELINILQTDPYSRRNMVMLWNPSQNTEGVLTPCWFGCKISVLPSKHGTRTIHMKLWNRSLDVCFGMLYAIQQYRLLQAALCHMTGYELGELSADMTDIHIYDNQLEYAKEIVQREYNLNPSSEIFFNKDIDGLEDLLSLEWSDITIKNHFVNKKPFVNDRPPMVA